MDDTSDKARDEATAKTTFQARRYSTGKSKGARSKMYDDRGSESFWGFMLIVRRAWPDEN